MFINSTSSTAPIFNMKFHNPSVNADQYCNFNQSYGTTSGSLKTIQTCNMTVGQSAYFQVSSGSITLFLGNGNTNLTITKLY